MAVKIMLPETMQSLVPDLPGEKFVVDRAYYKTFDIISINEVEEFVVNDLPTYPAFFKASGMVGQATAEAIAAGKTPAEIQAITGQIFATEYLSKVPEATRPYVGALLQKISAAKSDHLLSETYSSWVPYAYDATRAVKYSFRPCTNTTRLSAPTASPNFLGENVRKDLASIGSGCFDLVAHFHESSMPSVENAALPWGDPSTRKYIKLGRLTLKPQFEDISFCQSLSYNPAHALPNQRGIGVTQRARRIIYSEISAKRNTGTGM
jgi:hypothetical protein